MGKKRQSNVFQESHGEDEKLNEKSKFAMEAPSTDSALQPLKPMERRKKRKKSDKERHQHEFETKELSEVKKAIENSPVAQMKLLPLPKSGLPGFHIDVFKNLASVDLFARKNAAESLITELIEVQKAYEQLGKNEEDKGNVQLEAEKDDGLDGCAPSLRYAIRRLIRGVSSSRECARQGFSLGLAAVVEFIPAVKVESVMTLTINLLEVSSAMKGLEARDCYLGRLFAYGSIARSHRLTTEWSSDKNTHCIREFIGIVILLAQKKRYLQEPAVAVILDVVEKLPTEAFNNHVFKAPGMHEWFQKAAENGNPDALFLALKLREKIQLGREMFGDLLPHPFNAENFFSRDNLQNLELCFKESTFCLPRLHSIWQFLVNFLIPDIKSHADEVSFNMKNKKSRKCSSSEDFLRSVKFFCEVVIEETLLQSSHDRKHLALNILQLLLQRLPASCISSVLSHKLVYCLMDILSTKSSWLYNGAQLFLKELVHWADSEEDRRAAVIVYLQKYSNGRFDCITKTNTVKDLITKFKTFQGCLNFLHKLMSLFVDEAVLTDEPSDQSQTTDENSEIGSIEDKDSLIASGNAELLKNWVINIMPRALKNLKADLTVQTEIVNFMEGKFKVQTEIAKFLAVQGLFSPSLGTEVTSFELQEKFKWPKIAISNSLCKMCIEQLQLLLEDAQKEKSRDSLNDNGLNDIGSFFMRFLKTLCSIPSVSFYRTLSNEDKKAISKLQAIESGLYQKQRTAGPGLAANKLNSMRYLLIQLVLQILLHPDDFSEATLDFSVCCRKIFPSVVISDSSGEEDDFDDNKTPELMDVFVETLLSILPRSSPRMCYAAEQVFRVFCGDISDYGLRRMLRVVKKDLKPLRRSISSDEEEDEEEDDVLGIEDIEEHEEGRETSSSSSSEDESKEGVKDMNIGGKSIDKSFKLVDDSKNEGSDESDGGMDDDAMFRMDAYHAQLLKGRSGNDNALSQLILFKLRVLSLLEIYAQKNSGKSNVLAIYTCLIQSYTKYCGVNGNDQLVQRISGILHKKIFKEKEYPRGDDILLDNLEKLLQKSVKAASRSRVKEISSLSQASAFWLIKIINSRTLLDIEAHKIVLIFERLLADYFNNRNCRLKSGFIKEIIKRHHWLGVKLFEPLLDNCLKTKAEFRKIEAVDMIDCIIQATILTNKIEGDNKAITKSSKMLKSHMPSLCKLILQLLKNLPGKQSRRAEVRRFCSRVFQAVSILNLKKSFCKAMMPEGFSVCELHLGGNAVLPFK